MKPERIGILHPGAMGISLAATALNGGHDVYWASEGRSLRPCPGLPIRSPGRWDHTRSLRRVLDHRERLPAPCGRNGSEPRDLVFLCWTLP